MDKAQAKVIQTDVIAALRDVYARHGLELGNVRVTYDTSEFNLTAKARSVSEQDRSEAWNKYAPVFGLPSDAVGQEVRLNGKNFRIVSLELSRRKFPVRVQNVATGEYVLFTEDAVRRALNARQSIGA